MTETKDERKSNVAKLKWARKHMVVRRLCQAVREGDWHLVADAAVRYPTLAAVLSLDPMALVETVLGHRTCAQLERRVRPEVYRVRSQRLKEIEAGLRSPEDVPTAKAISTSASKFGNDELDEVERLVQELQEPGV